MNYIDIVKRWKDKDVSTVSRLEDALSNFCIIFAYNSAKIENDSINYYDTREIFQNGKVSSYTGDLRTLFEQQNQKDCYEFLKEKIISKEKVSIQLIKDIHKQLTKGTFDERRFIDNNERPGEFKKQDYVVGKNEVGFPPEQVEQEMESLIIELNEVSPNDILKAGCYFHAVFENIHPFADGNGRVGRTLLNYYLMINNHPPIIVFDEDKYDYYRALESYDVSENLVPLYDFMQYQCEKTWMSKSRNARDYNSRQKLDEINGLTDADNKIKQMQELAKQFGFVDPDKMIKEAMESLKSTKNGNSNTKSSNDSNQK